jgi:two-component system, LytTR family, sensor kinase
MGSLFSVHSAFSKTISFLFKRETQEHSCSYNDRIGACGDPCNCSDPCKRLVILSIARDTFPQGVLYRFFVYLTIVVVSIAIDAYQRAREMEMRAAEIESHVLQVQFESLKMRLDPAFFFRILNQLSTLMVECFDTAESLVASLGDYLRMRLYHCNKTEAKLRQEIELIKCYLEVEKLHDETALNIDLDIDSETLEHSIPSGLLQALIEDAVDRNSREMKLKVQKTNSALTVLIREANLQEKSSGPKVEELVRQLNQLYGNSIHFYKENRVTRIEIPLELSDAVSQAHRASSPAQIEDTSFVTNPIRKWLIIIAIFTGLAIYFTLQRVIVTTIRGATMNWPQQLLDCTGWYIWALITPLVLKVSAKYPLQKPWLKPVTIHLLSLILMWSGATLMFAAVQWAANLGQYSYWQRMPISVARSPFSLDIICYATIVAVESALRYDRRFKFGEIRAAKLGAQFARAKVYALKLQLHPHFLFNALNSLSQLMQEDPTAAEEMIGNLKSFLRMTIDQDDLQEVPFEKELAALQCYLAIENVRYQERLNVKMHIEPETLAVKVPNLFLQPIVENAIRHGVAPRSKPGEIEIHAKRVNGMLEVSVQDNGPGIKQLKKHHSSRSSGLGLANTKERLMQLYGHAHRFELINVEQGGLLVLLSIPVHEVGASP